MRLLAKNEEHTLYIRWMLKWRPLRYYQGKNAIPSRKIQDEIIERFRLNSGVDKDTPIELKWVTEEWHVMFKRILEILKPVLGSNCGQRAGEITDEFMAQDGRDNLTAFVFSRI